MLLKGPSENAQPQYPIVEKIENSGQFVWTPKKNLEPTDNAEGYGIQLIDDKTGQYQYTTQFGISNPDYKAEDETSSYAAPSSTSHGRPGAYGHGGRGDNGHGGHGDNGHGGSGHGGHNVRGGYSHSAASGTASGLTSSYTHRSNGTASSGRAHSTGYATRNVTMVSATGGYTSRTPQATNSPTGSDSSATASTPTAPQATDNGAAVMVSSLGGLVLAAGAAVFVL